MKYGIGLKRTYSIVEDDIYVKDPAFPHEDNWVWSPQGEIAMHLPERWGFLQFSEVN